MGNLADINNNLCLDGRRLLLVQTFGIAQSISGAVQRRQTVPSSEAVSRSPERADTGELAMINS